MKSEHKNDEKGVQTPLHIFCHDMVIVCDKVTFYSYMSGDVHVTHWFEDKEDTEARLTSIFAILFEEVARKRKEESNVLLNDKNL